MANQTDTNSGFDALGERVSHAFSKLIYVVLCVLLCVLGYVAKPSAGSEASGETMPASSVQMLEYNKGLEQVARDDDYRTTYEIFVSSFCDSDADGIGDLNGIRNTLDYISAMGFDQLWLTPVHPSATYHKYDVDDYLKIDPAFGSMEDYEALLEDCHARGIRVLMDLVLNHTSDTHPWFRAATDYLRELPNDWEPDVEYCPYFDYYHFSRTPQDGYVQLEGTNWYYEARFWSEMPDLNLNSEAVRKEIRNVLQFWLDKGVDGFRLDAVTSYATGSPQENVEFLSFLTKTCKGIDPDCYLVGEAWTDRSSIATLYTSGIDSLFDFPFADSGGIIAQTMNGSRSAYDYVREMVDAEAAYRGANPDYVDAPFYTNHDTSRSASFYSSDEGPVTKMAYALSLFMPGDSFVYYGEELGMEGAGKDENKRGPMYWSDNAQTEGMCSAPSNMDEVQMKFPSLEAQTKDDLSLWRWFAEVIRVRKAFPAIARGTTEMVDGVCDEGVAAFIRRSADDQDVLVVMNLRGQATEKDLSTVADNLSLAAVLGTNDESISYNQGKLNLPAYSIAVLTFGKE
ncbi:MAG: DUF3459 domain-containing protein [Atopobiaceae bacterium]|nr:DUF3459 domain-containing protein [Atopobiaceae bacterium]MDO4403965.1 alpha-amylase family glycosyl hydrolase [Atopobiaceae bacterium]